MGKGETASAKHIPILDGIRAYAVLMVCVFHFFSVDESGLYEANRYLGIFLFKISEIGQKGVELFFILSGFLITGILLDSKSSANYFTTFYARRFLRIFPLYYFVLFVSFIILPRLIAMDAPGLEVIHNQIWHWTYTYNLHFLWPAGGSLSGDGSVTFPWFTHFWSLCVEEHFYILWPFLIYVTSARHLPKLMWTIVVCSAGLVAFKSLGDTIPILKWSTLNYAGVLSLGGLIAWYRRRNPLVFPTIIRFARQAIVPLGILFLAIAFTPRNWGIHGTTMFFTSVLFFASLIVVALSGERTTSALFGHSFLFFIGKISYGIYIYHGMLTTYFKVYIWPPLVHLIPNGIVASCIYTLVCTSLSILLASVSWYLLESPILSFKRRFRY